jgi:branched-chain amino acid transport system substrate-binding protein
MTWWTRLAMLAGVVLASSGCGGSSTPAVVHFGHVATLSGADKMAGEQAARGIRLAVQEASADKTADSRPIVRHTDTRGKLEAFEAEAVRLATINKAVALYGGTTVDEVLRLERSRVPVLTPLGVRTAAMGELVFTTGVAPEFRARVLARHAIEDLGLKHAAVLVDEQREDLLLLADSFVQTFTEIVAKKDPKAEVARPRMHRFGKDAKYKELAARVAEEKPAVLLLAVAPEALREILRQLGQPRPTLLYGASDGNLVTLPHDSGSLYAVTSYVTEAESALNQEFVQKFMKAYSEEPDVHAALAYDGARLLFEAQRRSKGNEPLRAELAKIKDFAGLTGALSFMDQRLQRPAFIVRLDKQPDRPVQIKTMKRYAPES